MSFRFKSTNFSKYFLILLISRFVKITGGASETCSNLVPANYNQFQPPNEDTVVALTFSVQSIDRVHVATRTFSVQIEVYLMWSDERLYQSNDKLKIYYDQFVPRSSIDCFWVPEVTIEGLLTSSLMDNSLKKPRLRIGKDTDQISFLMESFNLQVRCPMEFTWYPMDTQTCQIVFNAYKSSKISLGWFRKLYNDSTNLDTSYSVLSIKQLAPSAINTGAQHLVIEFNFARRPVVALITIYFPSGLIVSVSFVSFWIDSQSVPGRISLIVTSLLALMTQLVSVRNTIPDVSYITALDVWFFACIIFVSCALFEFAVCYTQSNRRQNVLTPVIYNRFYDRSKVRSMGRSKKNDAGHMNGNYSEPGNSLSGNMKEIAFFNKDAVGKSAGASALTDVMDKFRERIAKGSALDLDIISRYTFPLTFTLFCAVYWTGFIVAKDH